MIESAANTAAIEAAPAFARLGLSVRDERLRRRAAEALADAIAEHLHRQPAPEANADQLPFVF